MQNVGLKGNHQCYIHTAFSSKS